MECSYALKGMIGHLQVLSGKQIQSIRKHERRAAKAAKKANLQGPTVAPTIHSTSAMANHGGFDNPRDINGANSESSKVSSSAAHCLLAANERHCSIWC